MFYVMKQEESFNQVRYIRNLESPRRTFLMRKRRTINNEGEPLFMTTNIP